MTDDEIRVYLRSSIISNLVAFSGQVLTPYNIESLADGLMKCINDILKKKTNEK